MKMTILTMIAKSLNYLSKFESFSLFLSFYLAGSLFFSFSQSLVVNKFPKKKNGLKFTMECDKNDDFDDDVQVL